MEMKHVFRLISMLVVVFTTLFFTVSTGFAAEAVNWEESTITVKGTGLAPKNAVSPTQARILSRRAAIVDGYRLLAESIKGVNVDAETTVENLVLSSDVVRTNVSACIKGAVIVSEKEIPGGYEVTMQIKMFGDSNPLAAAVLPRPPFQEPFPEPDESVDPLPDGATVDVDVNVSTLGEARQNVSATSLMASNTAKHLSFLSFTNYSNALPLAVSYAEVTNKKPAKAKVTTRSSAALKGKEKADGRLFTGLVVDCRGLGLNCAMSPVIKNKKGEAIYGHKNLDYDLVISKGMVSYTTDIDNYDRAGFKPLIVKAISLENFNGNPVISVADANRVLIENQKAGFLDQMNVVFVR